ncbi:hypothetical protein Ocin01_05987 [Orchesella cincta]|uniref:Uncharacterized protein n=1 Tax=Orchesella cincta TaxID=48709 RepID=A0A1D2N621_ORCCI|nr:hypothetical protein Ocin01_05987 [Orchesella cincta]
MPTPNKPPKVANKTPKNVQKTKKETTENFPAPPLPPINAQCNVKPNLERTIWNNACSAGCKRQLQAKLDCMKQERDALPTTYNKPDEFTDWYWDLKQKRLGCPPSSSHIRSAKYRWEEQRKKERCTEHRRKPKFIHPYETRETHQAISGGIKRKIVERWGKMWDSLLSDLQFDRIVFENNPDAEQTYKSHKERIDDGCRKLWSIAKMNQNIITMMMKKFVSGPPNKLYTLNRIEAAQCWERIINNKGVVKQECCVDLPHTEKKRYDIPSLRVPKSLKKDLDELNRGSVLFIMPKRSTFNEGEKGEGHEVTSKGKRIKKKPSTYWLNPKLVPPVPSGFIEEEFEIDPKHDPTGEIRRDLKKARNVAKRYTRFAHIIERAVHVVPNLDRVNEVMDANFVAKDPSIRRQTLLHNFFSSQKMNTSPEFRHDALYATILSRNDNPKERVEKKNFPYILGEMSKAKLKMGK